MRLWREIFAVGVTCGITQGGLGAIWCIGEVVCRCWKLQGRLLTRQELQGLWVKVLGWGLGCGRLPGLGSLGEGWRVVLGRGCCRGRKSLWWSAVERKGAGEG